MKRFITIFLTFLTCSTSPSFSKTTALTNFEPYADLTINAYWSSKYQDMEPMDLVSTSTASGIQAYRLAFITDAGNCTPAWGAQSSYPVGWGSHLTTAMQKNHISYIISFGGASGADLSAACSLAALTTAYSNVIATYQPQGLDFDIENGSANVANIMTALQSIQKTNPTLKLSFTLPVLPEGLVENGKDILNQATAAGLNYSVNIMAMDYGPAYTGDMEQYAEEAATNVFNFLKMLYPNTAPKDLWARIQITPMIGVNDVNTEAFTLADAAALNVFDKKNGLGAISMWSVARDQPCAAAWASPTCSGKNLQTLPYEFSKNFL